MGDGRGWGVERVNLINVVLSPNGFLLSLHIASRE